jgi:hypothetical protein
MIIETMYGPQFAKDYINSYLKSDIPRRLIRYRNSWNVDSIELPSPESYLDYEPLALDTWPTIITVVISTKRFDRVNHIGNFDPYYSVVYGVRTYVWVRTEGSEQATLMRDRLTTVVRSALLDYPCLNRSNESRRAKIFEETMTEEFSDLTLLKGDRVLAGAYLGYDIELEEVIAREPYGTLDELDLSVMTMQELAEE